MHQLNKQQQRLVEDFCEENDYSLCKGYSGRGMFGRKCLGISFEKHPAQVALDLIAFAAASEEIDDCEEFLAMLRRGGINQDSMGQGTILYFENIQWGTDEF